MKNMILRILISAILFSFITGIVVAIIGFILRWETATQFSDGFFLAGGVMLALGFLSYQGYRQRTINRLPLHLDPAKLAHLWATDTLRGKNIMAFFGLSGLLLFGLSFLVSKLF